MQKEMYKLWIKFNSYTGNFEREFIAYMLGQEVGEYNEGSFAPYTNDYITHGNPLEKMEDILLYTAQEVDDWTEETFYNIDNFPPSSKECGGIFIQLSQPPTQEMMDAFKKRMSGFVNFYSQTETYAQKNLKIMELSLEKVITQSQQIKNYDF